MCTNELGPNGTDRLYILTVWLTQIHLNWLTDSHIFELKSNHITFIVTSPQHVCLGERNSWDRAPDSAETIYI